MRLPRPDFVSAMGSARMDVFARGQVCALADAGHAMADIRQRVEKQDQTHPSLRSVAEIVARHREDPSWRGEDSNAGGRQAMRAPIG